MIFSIFNSVREWALERGIYDKEFVEEHHIANMMEELTEGLRATTEHEKVDFAVDNIIYAINYLEHRGYDSRLCCAEGLAEISSRKQCPEQKKLWNESGSQHGVKWEKWKDQPKDSLYKASYEKCLRKEEK